jgi:hypothetical protein
MLFDPMTGEVLHSAAELVSPDQRAAFMRRPLYAFVIGSASDGRRLKTARWPRCAGL